MADTKTKVNRKIDQAASKSKSVAGKAIDKGKEAARNMGQKMKETGQKIKNQGK